MAGRAFFIVIFLRSNHATLNWSKIKWCRAGASAGWAAVGAAGAAMQTRIFADDLADAELIVTGEGRSDDSIECGCGPPQFR